MGEQMALRAMKHLGARADRQAMPSAALICAAALLIQSPAAAVENPGLRLSILGRESGVPVIMDMTGPLGLIFVGLTILTTVTALLHLAGRRRWSQHVQRQTAEIGDLQARLQQAEVFMAGDRQVVVAWGGPGGEPVIEGDVSLLAPDMPARRVLSFGQWLRGGDVRRLEEAVERLKARGEPFSLAFDVSGGRRVDVDGRPSAGRAVMRIREVSGDRLERQRAEEKFGKLAEEMAALHAVLDAMPHPLWLRYADGRLAWVNRAYAEAVDCRHPNEAIAKGLELLDAQQRQRAASATPEVPFRAALPVIVGGKRAMLDVAEMRTPFGSGGIGVDDTARADMQALLDAEMATLQRILNDLPTAVAFFDRKHGLKMYNVSYQKLWGLETEFLSTGPSDTEILDRLRADRRLPEQVDFRSWKQALLDGYRAQDPAEHHWHLPDGRMLRVVASPTTDGGMSYLYHDMTERMSLEAQFKAMTRVQDETLDSLKEGVAVFGSDGRLKLSNAAFATMWRLPPEVLRNAPHIGDVMRNSAAAEASAAWATIRDMIISLAERRDSFAQRETGGDGRVLDIAAAPLPNGDMLLTFANVTDEVNAERFLQEKNEALETAANMKNAVINNLSYELRNPLQGVTMSAGILADETIVGAMTAKQRGYALDAKRSADALLIMMNEIFDLASLDAGTLELDLETLDPGAEIDQVATAFTDRLATANVRLESVAAGVTRGFMADRQRLRQVIFHLLSNAIRFSPAGSAITISAREAAPFMEIAVRDRGPGIPDAIVPRMFERFERVGDFAEGRGVGLGLPLVKALVELHGGVVSLVSRAGEGTTVTCLFPLGAAEDASWKVS
jgi:signal transduction histidine kinase